MCTTTPHITQHWFVCNHSWILVLTSCYFVNLLFAPLFVFQLPSFPHKCSACGRLIVFKRSLIIKQWSTLQLDTKLPYSCNESTHSLIHKIIKAHFKSSGSFVRIIFGYFCDFFSSVGNCNNLRVTQVWQSFVQVNGKLSIICTFIFQHSCKVWIFGSLKFVF